MLPDTFPFSSAVMAVLGSARQPPDPTRPAGRAQRQTAGSRQAEAREPEEVV